jgi:Fic family protein
VLVRIFREGLGRFTGGLRAENYLAITKTSRTTAARDLLDLVEMEMFRRTGKHKHTRYALTILFPFDENMLHQTDQPGVVGPPTM